MKHLYFFVCWWGVGISAYGQGQVSGKIIDKQTHQPVPYTSVVVLGGRAGTTSNVDGEFVLAVSSLPGKLVISQLGYGRDTVAIVAAGTLRPIELVPATVTLPAVDLGSYSAELLKKAYHKLQRSNASQQYGQAFYRQVTRLDNRPTEVQEMVWNVRANSAGLAGTSLAQARYAKKKDVLISQKNHSFFTKDFVLYALKADTMKVGGILSPNPTNYYTLTLLGITQDGQQNLAEIEFVGKPAFNQNHVQGVVVIDIDTYQVLRFKGASDAVGKSNNPTFKFKQGRLSYDYVFKPLPPGAVPDHLTVTYTVAMGRMLKPDIQVQAVGFTYFYNWQPTPTGLTYDEANTKESDIAAIKQTTYDSAFWRDNPVVKRTPLEEEIIKSFEQEKAFGTMLAK